MRRALPAIAASAAALTWLLHVQGIVDDKVATPSSAATPTGTGPTGTGPTGGPGTTTQGTTGAAPTVPPTSGASHRTVDGPTVDTPFGPVQVEVVLAGSKIVDVKALQSPGGRRRSIQINQQAIPLLHEQVMSAQSAQIDGVSGATYTTDGYEQSLQAALDHAGLHR
jgi:uncharacterized protein with FMN-binding domain